MQVQLFKKTRSVNVFGSGMVGLFLVQLNILGKVLNNSGARMDPCEFPRTKIITLYVPAFSNVATEKTHKTGL